MRESGLCPIGGDGNARMCGTARRGPGEKQEETEHHNENPIPIKKPGCSGTLEPLGRTEFVAELFFPSARILPRLGTAGVGNSAVRFGSFANTVGALDHIAYTAGGTCQHIFRGPPSLEVASPPARCPSDHTWNKPPCFRAGANSRNCTFVIQGMKSCFWLLQFWSPHLVWFLTVPKSS